MRTTLARQVGDDVAGNRNSNRQVDGKTLSRATTINASRSASNDIVIQLVSLGRRESSSKFKPRPNCLR